MVNDIIKVLMRAMFYFVSVACFGILLFCIGAIICSFFQLIIMDIFWPGMIFALIVAGFGAIGFFKKASATKS